MKQRNLLLLILTGIICTVALITGTGCANIIPPSGGPKDTIPPELVHVSPPDSFRNFASKKIVFDFNEYVQLDNYRQFLLVNPAQKIDPTMTSHLRTVTLKFEDTLEPNTTYTISFGNSIKDVNEGNVIKNFRYIFTTGRTLDSLDLSGKVIIAETGKTDTTLIVVLYKSLDDSALLKDRPRYVTRLDHDGNFRFNNLPPGTYALYAFKDDGGSKRFSKTELFAFADSPVVTTSRPHSLTLYAYQEKDTTKQQSSSKSVSIPKPGGLKNSPGANAVKDKRLRLEANIPGGELDLLHNLEIIFRPGPLKTFDSTKIHFTDGKLVPITTGYTMVMDTSRDKLTLTYKWPENTPFNIIFEKDFAEDTSGHKLSKNDTIAFRTKKESDYALVRLRFLNLDLTKNPVLEFTQSDQVKFSYALTTREFYARLFLPGDYDLRILYDDNKNGKWDPGEFFKKHKQPEKVLPIPRKLSVKANWNNEVDITL